MTDKVKEFDCAFQATGRAISIKASQRAALETRNFSIEGIAREMARVRGEDLNPATLRRYLSDTYPSCMPVDQIHPWYVATDGDLSPVQQQLHLCGKEIRPLYCQMDPLPDSPRLAAEVSHESGDLVALLLQQWSDGRRSMEERREALPHLIRLRAQLDHLITIDEAVVGPR